MNIRCFGKECEEGRCLDGQVSFICLIKWLCTKKRGLFKNGHTTPKHGTAWLLECTLEHGNHGGERFFRNVST